MSKFEIGLLIRHPNIDTDKISKKLELKPYVSWNVGEKIVTPKGNEHSGIRTFSCWNHVFKYNDGRFFEAIKQLLKELYENKDFFEELVKDGGYIELILSMFGDVYQGDTADPAVLAQIAEMGIHFGINLFPIRND